MKKRIAGKILGVQIILLLSLLCSPVKLSAAEENIQDTTSQHISGSRPKSIVGNGSNYTISGSFADQYYDSGSGSLRWRWAPYTKNGNWTQSNDILSIGPANGTGTGSFDMGDGNDSIYVSGTGRLNASSISMGSGNDKITIENGTFSASSIDMGTGDDSVYFQNGNVSGVGNINMGDWENKNFTTNLSTNTNVTFGQTTTATFEVIADKGSINYGGNVSFNSAAGKNIFILANPDGSTINFTGRLQINKDGSSSTTMNIGKMNGSTSGISFNNANNIDFGSGSNNIIVENNNANQSSVNSFTSGALTFNNANDIISVLGRYENEVYGGRALFNSNSINMEEGTDSIETKNALVNVAGYMQLGSNGNKSLTARDSTVTNLTGAAGYIAMDPGAGYTGLIEAKNSSTITTNGTTGNNSGITLGNASKHTVNVSESSTLTVGAGNFTIGTGKSTITTIGSSTLNIASYLQMGSGGDKTYTVANSSRSNITEYLAAGAGDGFTNTVNVTNIGQLTIGQHLTLSGSTNNINILGGSTLAVNGTDGVRMGDGTNNIVIDGSTSTVAGDVNMGGGGNKSYLVKNNGQSTIGGNLVVGAVGTGNTATITVRDPGSTLTVNGSQGIVMGNGTNRIILDGGNITAANGITMGDGNSTINLIKGSYNISKIEMGGNGNKNIESSTTGSTDIVFGSVGSGNVARLQLTDGVLGGSATYQGSDNGVNNFNQTGGEYTGRLNLLSGSVNINITGGKFSGQGNFSQGTNTLNISGSEATYAGDVNLGHGNNTINFGTRAILDTTAKIQTGDGGNTYNLGFGTYRAGSEINSGIGADIYNINASSSEVYTNITDLGGENTWNYTSGTIRGTLNSSGRDNETYNMSGANFLSGANITVAGGNNVFNITGGRFQNNINVAEGNNKVYFNYTSGNSIHDSTSSFVTGTGDDEIYIGGGTYSVGSLIDAGDGNNTFNIYAGGNIGSTLKGGTGQDTYNIFNGRNINIIDAGSATQNTENNTINLLAGSGTSNIKTIRGANVINVNANSKLYVSDQIEGTNEYQINVKGENSYFWLQKTSANATNTSNLVIDQGGMARIDQTTLVGDVTVGRGTLLGHTEKGRWTTDGNVYLSGNAMIVPFKADRDISDNYTVYDNDNPNDAATYRVSQTTTFAKNATLKTRLWATNHPDTEIIDGHQIYASDSIYSTNAVWLGQAKYKPSFQGREQFVLDYDNYYRVVQSENDIVGAKTGDDAFDRRILFSDMIGRYDFIKTSDNKSILLKFRLLAPIVENGGIAGIMPEPNAREAGRVLDKLRIHDQLPVGFHDFFLGIQDGIDYSNNLHVAIRQIHAESYATLATITMDGLRQFRNIREQRTTNDLFAIGGEPIQNLESDIAFAALPEYDEFYSDLVYEPLRFWTAGFGSSDKQGNVRTEYGFKSDSYGVALGARKDFDMLYAAVAAGFAHRNIDWNGLNAHAKNESVMAQAVVGIDTGTAFAELIAEYAYNRNKIDRNIAIGSYRGHASSRYHEHIYGGGARIGYSFIVGDNVMIIPTLAVYYNRTQTPALTESGSAGALNLHINKIKYHNIEAPLGIRINKGFALGDFILTPELRGEITGTFGNKRGKTVSTFSGDPTQTEFRSIGIDTGMYRAKIGAGIDLSKNGRFNTSVNYDYLFARKLDSHNFSFNFGVGF